VSEYNIPCPERPEHLVELLSNTPARVGVWRAGSRPLTSVWLKFRQDHAQARDAVQSELSGAFVERFIEGRGLPLVQSLAESRSDFILNPPRGKRVSSQTLAHLKTLCPAGRDVQIVISDGLSARAVEDNVPDLLPMLEHGLELENISCGLPVVVRFGRVAVADLISHALEARVAINLIGERPGLSSVGLSAYITYNPGPQSISSDRTVVSNIHAGGTPAAEAGAYIVHLVKRILELEVSGVRLQELA
jgi:ethanolamine ammonia-lyase small subunit